MENQKKEMSDKNNYKEVYFILSSKGGVGKSFFSTMIAHHKLGEEKAKQSIESAYFDLDNSNNTLKKQLEFLKNIKTEKGHSLIQKLDLTNENGYIIRDLLYNCLEDIIINFSDINNYYIDCGSTESKQLLYFIEDIGIENLNIAFKEELKINVNYIVLVAGESLFKDCMHYLNSLNKVINNQSKIIVALNNKQIKNRLEENHLIKEIKKINGDFKIISFGKLDSLSNLTNEILATFSEGKSTSNYNFLTKNKFKNLLEPIKLLEK